MKKIFLILIAAATMFAGCREKENIVGGATGTLAIGVSCDESDYIEKNPLLKSDAVSEDDFVNSFLIKLTKSDGTVIFEGTKLELTSSMELAPGHYTISASSPSTELVAWDQPIYWAEREFDIIEKVVTPVDLVCSLSNMKVSIQPTEKFLAELSEFSISVSAEYPDDEESPRSLTWSRNEVTANKAGYFAVAPLTVSIAGYRAIDHSEAHAVYKINEVSAKDHHILIVDAKVTGDATLSLTIDYSVNDRPVDIEVPGFVEVPIPDEPDPDKPVDPVDPDPVNPDPVSDAPTLEWPTNPDMAPMDIAEGMVVNLLIHAPAKIASFIVNVSENFQSLISVMTTDNVPYLDMINDQAVVSALQGQLPVGDEVKGQTELEFPLSNLLPLILQVGNKGEDYVFTLDVTDEKGQKLSKSLTFHNPA